MKEPKEAIVSITDLHPADCNLSNWTDFGADERRGLQRFMQRI